MPSSDKQASQNGWEALFERWQLDCFLNANINQASEDLGEIIPERSKGLERRSLVDLNMFNKDVTQKNTYRNTYQGISSGYLWVVAL